MGFTGLCGSGTGDSSSSGRIGHSGNIDVSVSVLQPTPNFRWRLGLGGGVRVQWGGGVQVQVHNAGMRNSEGRSSVTAFPTFRV